MKEELAIIGIVAAFLAVAVSLIITPIAYFDGSAKSDWLKQTRGIEIPWYRATWLEVNISDIDANVKSK